MVRTFCTLWLLCSLVFGPGPAAQQRPPLELGIEEAVDVHLVLIDFLVLDRKERTVPGLTLEDFVLVVGGKEIELASLDLDCPVGQADDPRPGPDGSPLPDEATIQPRKIVMVFDYFHMSNHAETFEMANQALDKWPGGDEQHMVVSLGDVVRIESPFTADLDEVRWTLQRMRNDPDLYAGNYGRLTEKRFFDKVQILFDLLERVEGRKTIVLFSGPFLNDGWTHDEEYRDLSALSAAARTAVYPVDTGGLRVLTDPLGSRIGGPPMLRRLANETGGRMTADTNEIGLAYAKAHRDLGCTYTLGFYDNRPRFDRERRMTIRIRDRNDLRVVYPEFYVVRSREKKRKSLFQTASMTPQMFESDEMGTDLFVLGPDSEKKWRAVQAVEIDLGPTHFLETEEEWILRGLVRKPNGTVVRSFKKKVPMPASDPATGETPRVTVFQTLSIRPGKYIVSAVLSDPDGAAPLATTRPAQVAKIPRGEPFLVGPILGHRSADEAEHGFEPLMVAGSAQGEPLDSLTLVCVVGADRSVDVKTIARTVSSLEHDETRLLDTTSARLPQGGKPRCHRLLDTLVTSGLRPGRYEMTAVAETADRITGRGSIEFTIEPPGLD